jgi:hypothetical protein
VKIKVLPTFQHSPFYHKGDYIECEHELRIVDLFNTPFIIDMYPEKLAGPLPWVEKKDSVNIIWKKWLQAEQKLSPLFKERKTSLAKQIMIIQISAYIDFLFWTNGERVTQLKDVISDVEKLRHTPVNITERLAFILQMPHHYQSFIQLQQLFIESNKQYKRLEALQK